MFQVCFHILLTLLQESFILPYLFEKDGWFKATFVFTFNSKFPSVQLLPFFAVVSVPYEPALLPHQTFVVDVCGWTALHTCVCVLVCCALILSVHTADNFTDAAVSNRINGEHKEKDLEPWEGGEPNNSDSLESLDTDVVGGTNSCAALDTVGYIPCCGCQSYWCENLFDSNSSSHFWMIFKRSICMFCTMPNWKQKLLLVKLLFSLLCLGISQMDGTRMICSNLMRRNTASCQHTTAAYLHIRKFVAFTCWGYFSAQVKVLIRSQSWVKASYLPQSSIGAGQLWRVSEKRSARCPAGRGDWSKCLVQGPRGSGERWALWGGEVHRCDERGKRPSHARQVTMWQTFTMCFWAQVDRFRDHAAPFVASFHLCSEFLCSVRFSCRENKYIPPGQRNRDPMSWGPGRQNSPRLAQSSGGPSAPRPGPHDYSPNSGPDQRVVNGGVFLMSRKSPQT